MPLGQHIWLGWLMIGALLYSVVPPFILGRMKQPVAERLHDEVLHTDALMQKADWMTGLAGVAGILGLGFGLWWADALAAGIISLSILKDGITSLRIAAAELVDGTPRALGSSEIAPDAAALVAALEARWPDGDVRLRESGRYLRAQVRGVPGDPAVDLDSLWPGPPEKRWRFAELAFVPPDEDSR
jgi:divalent metal cation (Fe/Co/Zn/Cd) transporter